MIFSLILWSPLKNNFENVEKDLSEGNIRIVRKNIFHYDDENFEKMIKKVYEPDSIADWKVVKKLDELNKREKILCYIEVEIPSPRYRIKSDGRHISVATEEIKKFVRAKYARFKPFQGKPDILIHMGDTHEHTNYVYNTLKNHCSKKINLNQLIKNINDLNYVFTKVETPYQDCDFPSSYAVGKDIDILVDQNDSFKIFEQLNVFAENYSGTFKIKKIYESDGFRIRFLNHDNTLHYQLDVKISDLVIKESIDKSKVYNCLFLSYEAVTRVNALIKKPHKVHHKEFILENKRNIDLKIMKKFGILEKYKELIEV
mgnify:CR=1 FL=1